MSKRLPKKLAHEPLLEAICEVVVDSHVGLHAIGPGLMFGSLKVDGIEQLPMASLPDDFRRHDPGLAKAALVRVKWKNYYVMLGHGTIAVASRLPYPGWDQFKSDILECLDVLFNSNVISRVKRYSLKYLNIIPRPDFHAQHKAIDWHIEVGGHRIVTGPLGVRFEAVDDVDCSTIVTVSTGTTAQVSDTDQSVHGSLVEVDTIQKCNVSNPRQFVEELPQRLDKIRLQNKIWFVDCLSDSAIQEMGPIYE